MSSFPLSSVFSVWVSFLYWQVGFLLQAEHALTNEARFLKCVVKLQCVELSGQQRQRPIVDSSVKNKDVALKSGRSLGDGAPVSLTKAALWHKLTSGLASS